MAGTETITAATLTITASSPTVVYGSSVPVVTAGYSGLVNGDTAPSTLPTCSTAALKTSGVGSYTTTCASAADPNYAITYVAGTETIGTAPLTITASSPSVVYGSTVPIVTPAYSGVVNGDTAPAPPPTCSTAALKTSGVGSYTTTCASAADRKYAITYVAGTETIRT